MLVGLTAPLKQGDLIQLSLKFEKAGEIVVPFEVKAMGAPAPGPLSHAADPARRAQPPRCKERTMKKIMLYAACLLLTAPLAC